MLSILLSVSSLAFIVGFVSGFLIKLSYTKKKTISIENTKYLLEKEK